MNEILRVLHNRDRHYLSRLRTTLMIINSNFDWGCNGIEMDLRQVLACGIGDVSDLWASEFWSALGIGTEIRIENIAELLIKGLRQDCSRVVKRFNEEMFEYYSRLQEMELSPWVATAEVKSE